MTKLLFLCQRCVRHITRIKDEKTQINSTAKEIPENARSKKVDEVILKTDDLINKQTKNAELQTDGENKVFFI